MANVSGAGKEATKFKIVEEKQMHRRYLTLYDRKIEFRSQQGKEVSSEAILKSAVRALESGERKSLEHSWHAGGSARL